jgi:hypothetical protein
MWGTCRSGLGLYIFAFMCICMRCLHFGDYERRGRKVQKEGRNEGKSERRIDREVGNFGMRGKLMEKISRRTWKMNI